MSGPFGAGSLQYFSGGAAEFYNFPIEQSLRFNDDDSAYLSRTHVDGGEAVYTLSLWAKRSNLAITDAHIFGSIGNSGDDYELIRFNSSDQINWQLRDNTLQGNVTTNAVFRDPSAWYHLVFYRSGSTVKIYVNGVEQSITTGTSFSATTQWANNNAYEVRFGLRTDGASGKYDGYLAEVNFIDGTALDASSFGELKNGVWIPKDPSGLTYGTNGFRLSFADDAEVEAFNTVLWRGNGATQSITGMGFQPDLVWIKNRDQADWHSLFDPIRGAGTRLFTNETSGDNYNASSLTSWDSDGFTIGNNISINTNGEHFVAWGWKAGDSNVSNTDGSITSTVRANTTYGFSIVGWAGTGSAGTLGHGLSTVPKFIIVKDRDGAQNWVVYHDDINSDGNQYLELNSTQGIQSSSVFWNSTAPTSSLFSVGTSNSVSGRNFIAYCWAEKSGYSKFGSYTGSRTAGQTVTCGFRPAFLLVKNVNQSGSQGNWMIVDGTRETVNSRGTNILYPNDSVSESTIGSDDLFDFTDTGFNVLNTGDATAITAQMNGEGDTMIYAAFADTREAAFWLDQSGNDNDWQPVNLDHNDTVSDSPTDNFATWNPLASTGSGVTGYGWSMSDGNLVFTPTNASGYNNVTTSTMAMTSGKYYLEFKPLGTPTSGWPAVGLCYTDSISEITRTSNFQSSNDISILIFTSGNLQPFGSTSASAYGNAISSGDVLMLAVDCDNGKVWWGENGTWFNSGNPTTGTNAGDTFTAGTSVSILMTGYNGAGGVEINAGQQPFKYDPPA